MNIEPNAKPAGAVVAARSGLTGRRDGLNSARARRFSVDIVRADGSSEHLDRIGGTSIEHSLDGMERAGPGGVVRVRVVDTEVAQ